VATKRQAIVEAIVVLLKTIQGSPYESDLESNVGSKLVFWDEIQQYPTVSVVSGIETREYLSAGLAWAHLEVNITIFVQSTDPKDTIESIFADIENILDANNTLTIDGQPLCTDLRLLTLSDDNGVLAPLGVGEMAFSVQYNV
jgi:hypothetical protein